MTKKSARAADEKSFMLVILIFISYGCLFFLINSKVEELEKYQTSFEQDTQNEIRLLIDEVDKIKNTKYVEHIHSDVRNIESMVDDHIQAHDYNYQDREWLKNDAWESIIEERP